MKHSFSFGWLLFWIFLAVSPCFSESPDGAESLERWKAPEWTRLKLVPKPKENENLILFQNEADRTADGVAYPTIPVRIHMTPREKTPELTARIEPDGLHFKTPAIEGTGERCAQVQFFGLDPKAAADNDYCLYVALAGPKGAKGNLYYEGRYEDGRHYWKRLEISMNGGRQNFAFDQTIPVGLRTLYFRFDFFTPGDYTIHSVRLERETDSSDAAVLPPELIFRLPMDGTTEPEFAAGEKTPKLSENVEFVEGVQGEAARFTSANNAKLEFELAKNLQPEAGSISVWIRPDWSLEKERKRWRTILSMPWEFPTRIGSGAIWFWIYEGALRGDTSDLQDRYVTAPIAQTDVWRHLVFSWDRYGNRIYLDGKRYGGRGDGLNLAVPSFPNRYVRTEFDSFYIGRFQAWPFEGDLDELEIYSGPLSDDAVQKLYQRHRRPLGLDAANLYRFDDEKDPFLVRIKDGGTAAQPVELALSDTRGETILQKSVETVPGQTLEIPLEPEKPFQAGSYSLALSAGGETLETLPILVFDSRKFAPKKTLNKAQGGQNGQDDSFDVWDRELPLKLKETIELRKLDSSRIVFCGESSEGVCGGTQYLEMSPTAGERFAVHLEPLESQKLYCFEWDFPDDKKRTVDIIAQSSLHAEGSEYELQTGYLTGDEYPNGGKMLTQRALFWAKDSDISLIFMTARSTGSPESGNSPDVVPGGAAAAAIRVYEVTGPLPVARINPPGGESKKRREVGIYFEDPAINYDFAADGSKPDEFPTMLQRLGDYMDYTGQNFLAYPLVWYNGPIGPKYQPRPHLPRFGEAFLTVFDRTGRDFMATINQNNVSFEPPRVTRGGVRSGAYNNSPFAIHSTGTPHPGGWHGTPPIFQPLHPDVQKMTLEIFDELLDRCAPHPSFKGIILHLPRHALHSFGDIRAGYNDFLIERFEKETGISIPVDHAAPNRGKLYADWLLANKREEWIDWRCRVLAEWYKTLAAKMAAVRPDLMLGINCMIPILYEPTPEDGGEGEFWTRANREAGIDPNYYKDVPNIFLEQTVFPADYRWMENRSYPEIRKRLRKTEETSGMYGTLAPDDGQSVNLPWIQMHDRYWESPIGRADRSGGRLLDAPWLKEHPWRVSTLNPTGFEAMRHYLMPLRYHDLQGITKGGFLIGTYGMERELANFAAAFRALPAERFLDVSGSTETVKIRSLTRDDAVWFYIANTSDRPATVEVSGAKGEVVDLVRSVSGKPADGIYSATLSPMTLRSFRTSPGAAISVKVRNN